MKRALFLACCLTLLCLSLGSEIITPKENEQLWTSYRNALYNKLFNLYCLAKRGGCPNRNHLVFQMVDTPIDINKENAFDDAFVLNEQLCKFPTRVGAAYEFVCTTDDCSFPNNMKNAILSVPAGNKASLDAFKEFRNAQTVKAGHVEKSYPWRVTDKKTMCELYRCNPAAMNLVNEIRIRHTSPVDHLVYLGVKYFFRETVKRTPNGNNRATPRAGTPVARPAAPARIPARPVVQSKKKSTKRTKGGRRGRVLSDNIEEPMADADFLFRRRRSRPPPPPQPIPLPFAQFEMKLEANDIQVVMVEPGAWLNRPFLQRFRGQLSSFFNPGGKMPLMPAAFLVAKRPKVTIKVTRVTYQHLSAQLRLGSVQSIQVGGMEFKGKETKALSDDEFHLFDDEGNSDSIRFIPIEQANADVSTSSDNTPIPKDPIAVNNDIEEIAADADFLFRRRRRRSRPPPPPPPRPQTYSHHLVMESRNSQILAVISERMP